MSTVLQGIFLGVIAVLLFSLIIFVHEFGHFFTAKLSGVRVNEFAIGMGPKLFSFKRGETQYALRLLPIGGYCAMEGEDEESTDPHAFGSRPIWQRMIVVAMGGIMNILFAILLMTVLLGQEDRFATTQVVRFTEDSAVEAAGVKAGDKIIGINDYAIYSAEDMTFALSLASMQLTADETAILDIEVLRDGEKVLLEDVAVNTVDIGDGLRHIVLDFYVQGQKKTVWSLIQHAFIDTASTVRLVYKTLIGMVTGQFGLNDMAGPVGTAQVVTQAASIGLKSSFLDGLNNIIYLMLLISVNLGIVNLLPLPALDGGRLMFLLVELILRKPVPAKYEFWVHTVGFALLIVLMLVVTFNDILRLVRGG